MLFRSDHFIDHGDQMQLLADQGLDAAGIARAVREKLNKLGQAGKLPETNENNA